jgi:uncharacterized repeat protein (TIGR03803 family)
MNRPTRHMSAAFFCALRISAALLAGLLVSGESAPAHELKVLYNFCPQKNCSRSFSTAELLVDPSGSLYGTRENDGANGKGTAYKLTFDGKRWKYRTLHGFCSALNCTDGSQPEGGMIIDSSGNLYGTTEMGGNTNHGVFFEITADGTYEVLYSFCPDNNTCGDGAAPLGRLTYSGAQSGQPYDGSSPLYGTGVVSYDGVIFELTASGGTWTSTTAYSFGSGNGSGCVSDSITMDGAGNIFGATELCGDLGEGKAFVLANGQNGWAEISHFSFDDGDGFEPHGPLVEDQKGQLYVSATFGGKYNNGAIVRLSPVVDTYLPKVLHNFDWSDGAWPYGGLIADSSGNLFGTTNGGGKGAGATVFELSGTRFRALYQFCLHDNNCQHGSRPEGGVVLDTAGNLYGTTTLGGANGFGTVFELIPQ